MTFNEWFEDAKTAWNPVDKAGEIDYHEIAFREKITQDAYRAGFNDGTYKEALKAYRASGGLIRDALDMD